MSGIKNKSRSINDVEDFNLPRLGDVNRINLWYTGAANTTLGSIDRVHGATGGIKMKKAISTIAIIASFTISTNAGAVLIGGVDFPDGAVSFADAVVSYSPGPDVAPNYNDPNAALGIPDWTGHNFTAASLGNGGSLTLQFTDNSLTTSGDASPDLWIFEIGAVTEFFNVQISTDNISYIDLGDVLGQPTGVDIDAVAGVIPGTFYSYVMLTDVDPDQTGSPFGEADIDAVGAISSAPPVNPIPVPAAVWLFGTALVGFVGISRRRRVG